MTKTVQPLKTRLRALAIALALAIVLVPAVAAQAQTFNVLINFTGGKGGGYPYANLIQDPKGIFYTTTSYSSYDGDDFGWWIDIHCCWRISWGWRFDDGGLDGAYPYSGLVRGPTGVMYGTTLAGGASNYGTVFKAGPKEGKGGAALYSFTGGADGGYPWAGLVLDNKGNLYGTTYSGGSGYGTVFMVSSKTGTETVLHSFGNSDGAYPFAGLVRDPKGNLYGVTEEGGSSGYGTVFEVPVKGTYKVLYNFTGGADGGYPLYGYLLLDKANDLYGTTEIGGSSGAGTVFKLTPDGKETVLYSFTGGADGGYPLAGVILDPKGNLYGTTEAGGSSGYGTVFMVAANGTETVLHSFAETDGAYPVADLFRDKKGNLYGTTQGGGTSGYGTVFELTP
jgi:uncharacterized repeat protein (TIGR03803 family)